MKSVFKVTSIKTIKDVMKIKKAITSNEGIIACQISMDKDFIEVVYDDYFVKEGRIIECIENLGYTIV